ncbi:hypothetical protein MsAg5_04270 [Methanosarcinaceae archaeon Ag5]|uniref:N-acetyltransferase domain-containing protein n=1 Tax=Methanolapillus africanus TaxID=3028297 RepID=A0AAE4MJ47_9EURY|nr:hypothetical protein [Methanosarcinaceae archaeon Ag5]
MQNVTIRLETKVDHRIVEELTREAFWNLYVPGCSEHLILHKLRNSPDFIPELDFVAVCDGKIVGNIVFSKSKVVGNDGREFPTITFGPLSVLPEYQKQGIGAVLVNHSIKEATAMGFSAIFIYGFPGYYQRFGFKSASAYKVSRPDGKFAKAMMALPLQNGALENVSGRLFESPDFEAEPDGVEEFDATFPPKEKKVTESQKQFEVMADWLE